MKPELHTQAEAQLRFYRLVRGEHLVYLPGDASAIHDDPVTQLDHLEANKWLHKNLTIDTQDVQSYRDGLTRRMLFALERVSDRGDHAAIREGLLSNDPIAYQKAFHAVQEFVAAHPAVAERVPFLCLVQTLPPILGLTATTIGHHKNVISTGARPTVTKKNAPELWETMRTWRGSESLAMQERIATHTSLKLEAEEEFGLQLSSGLLPQMELLYFDAKRAVVGSSHEKKPIREATEKIIMMRAAECVWGERWRREVPERFDSARRSIANTEWVYGIPRRSPEGAIDKLVNPEDHKTIVRLLERENFFQRLAMMTVLDGTALSWDMFIHKLWNDPARVDHQWDIHRYHPSQLLKFSGENPLTGLEEDTEFHAQFQEALPVLLRQTRDGHSEEQSPPISSVLSTLTSSGPNILDTIRGEEVDAMVASGEITDDQRNKTFGPTLERLAALITAYDRKRLHDFRAALERIVTQPDLTVWAQQLSHGFFRDFFLYEAHKKSGDQRFEALAETIEAMSEGLGDGAEVNRAQDLMNRYVLNHYSEGRSDGHEWRKAELIRRGLATEHQLAGPFSGADLLRGRGGIERFATEAEFEAWHQERKRQYVDEAKQYIPSRYLYVFSDAAKITPDEEDMLAPCYKARLMAKAINGKMLEIMEKGTSAHDAHDLGVLKEKVCVWAPEKNAFRDFFLENIAHAELWQLLQTTSQAEHLAERGVRLATHQVNLRDHFQHGEDEGVLQEAYMIEYPVIRVEGLASQFHRFSIGERKKIADFFTDVAAEMSPVGAEAFERMAVQLEIDHLRADYDQWRQDLLPKDHEATEQERLHASNVAFGNVLDHITTRFPRANYHRDSILQTLMTDLATTPEHLHRIEKCTYQYYVRHPEEQRPGDEHQYTATESVKNFISMLKSREDRRRVLSWLYGGEITVDRFLEGSTFRVNEDEKIDAFWSLSSEERRTILYTALTGEYGLFDVDSFDSTQGNLSSEQAEFHIFLKDFYENNFKKLTTTNPRMEKAFRIAFFEAFTQYSPARRVELFLAISDQMRQARLQGEEMTMGSAMQLFLEQVGVIGVKAGQVLAEQQDLLPDDIRGELSSLKDRAQPFGKQGVFTYFKIANLFRRDRDGQEGGFTISEVGRLLGSASVKQVHLITTPEGEQLVGKVQRPTIDRNYDEDVYVLGNILERFSESGYNVPQWFLPEIERVVSVERDFGIEAAHAKHMREQLHARNATMMIGDREVPLTVPDVKFIMEKGQHRISNLQLMVEEFGRGLSLQDVMNLQHLEQVSDRSARDQEMADRIEQRLQNLYGGNTALVRDAFARIDVDHVRGQVALQLLLQIGQDGIFHADLHSGNIIVDLAQGEESVKFIDCGSAGESMVKQGDQAGADHRMAFSQFTQGLLTLRAQSPENQPQIIQQLAETLSQFASITSQHESSRPSSTWEGLLPHIVERAESEGDLFKNILSEALKHGAVLDQNFRYLLKALASAGGHFESLRKRIMTETGAT